MMIMRRRWRRRRRRRRRRKETLLFYGEREVRSSLGSQADPIRSSRKDWLETR
jgi:hypothetical protein